MNLAKFISIAVLLLLAMAEESGARIYSTQFPLTENPISEGGNWINGGTVGLQWKNARTTPGFCFGTETGSGGFDDTTAVVSGAWGATQTAIGRVQIGTEQSTVSEEVELRLRTTITANSITGYEILFGVGAGKPYIQIVKWNGPFGNFTALDARPGPGVHSGDIVMAKISGTTITAYVNGVSIFSVNDGTYSSGAPGVGFYQQNGVVGDDSNFGFSSFWATDQTTILAASTASSAVQTALTAATANSIVIIPPGSSSWTSGVSLSAPANVTVMGAGTYATGGGDQTVITDNIAGGGKLMDFPVGTTGVFRLTGITVQSGSGGVKDNGTVNFDGPEVQPAR